MASSRGPRGPQVCYQFRDGKCTRGDKCKFSHDISSPGSWRVPGPSSNTPARGQGPFGTHQNTPWPGGRGSTPGTTNQAAQRPGARGNTPADAAELTYRDWRRGLGREGDSPDLTATEMESFLQDAVEILETGPAGVKQSLVKDLGSNKGLRRIRQIVESDFTIAYSVTKPRFYSHCVKFLKLVSHEEIQSSLVLETDVGTIYNVIYGPQGSRGISFFRKVSDKLFQARTTPEDCQELEEGDVFEEALAAAAAALLNTIRLNQGAAVQPEFGAIVQRLRACYDQDESQLSSFPLRSAHQDIERIRERLRMGGLITSVKSATPGPGLPTPNFNLFRQAIDLPGLHSPQGRRHDNDFELIQEIKILPTTDEIMSERDPFLPLKDVESEHHLRGIYRLLDSQFRLLREDTSGQIRDGVRHLLNNWDVLVKGTDEKVKRKVQRDSQIQLRIYGRAKMERVWHDRKKGLVIDVSFDQPKKAAGLKKGKRAEWWKDCKELMIGSLLGLIGEDKRTTFLLVSIRTVDAPHTEDSGSRPKGLLGDLVSNANRALITLSLTDPNNVEDQSRIISLAQNHTSELIMVEFPGMLYVSFEPVLKVLQNLQDNPNLPFTKWIIPQPPKPSPGTQSILGMRIRDASVVKVPPPLYLVRNRIPLDLSCITKNRQRLSFSIDTPMTPQELEQKTDLNRSQCEAMITGLQNELALIQGPPGTGKSHVGIELAKVLHANRDQTKIGPIVCVCYTNHALDQFLEHLLRSGIDQVVRLGSRSKNPALQNHTLQAINKSADRTKMERHEVWQCNEALDIVQDDMREVCDFISKPNDWKKLKSHLETSHPDYHGALYGVNDTDGWTEVVNVAAILNNWLQGRGIQDAGRVLPRTNRSIVRLLAEDPYTGQHESIWNMSLRERVALKQHWEKEMRDSIEDKLRAAVGTHTKINNTLKQQYRESDKRCLEMAHFVGVTTTGLATNSELLRSLPSKVLICEEAAEVLESHVLTALLPSVQHAILIGDHLQLRPQVSNYHLSMESDRGKKYGLDESLFERLANERFDHGGKFPIVQLDTQFRMHPVISSLVRETLYPKLRDFDRTQLHPEVSGMRKRLFWLDHRNLEDSCGDAESNSKTHEWEISMVIALVRHLSRQGVYKANDIAVLTPYLGQLQKLRKRLGSIFELIVGEKDQEQLDLEDDSDSEESPKTPALDVQKGKLLDAVRVSTVDNFQGDEAKVIIISLVRSNAQKNCGFLKTFNRINVLLSRARNGMYIIGNAETACGKAPMWTKVVELLEDGGNIGTGFPLQCVRHPNNRMSVATPEEFLIKSPEGGCSEKCGLRLECGHMCISKCHSDYLHKATRCMEPCIKQFPECGHSCPKGCWSPCGRCTLKIANVQLLCGHIAGSLDCFDARNLDRVKCSQTVTKKVPLCGHEIRVACHTDISKTRCTTVCGKNLPCGHQCNKQCWSCKKLDDNGDVRVNHGACGNICGRSFTTCNHGCPKVCHGGEPCSPCVRPCEIRCSHSKCPKKCNDSCPPCAEQCTWSCVHRERCTMPCAVPCDIIPCSKRCEENLSCGHRCPGVCGEACPKVEFCKECAAPEILERTVDFIMYDAYKNVDLDEDPILFLTCGHFYTVSSLDGIMDLKEAYIIDEEGKILGPKPASGVQSGKAPKGCPECRSPLRDIHRYNRVVKLALLDEATRRFVAGAHEVYMGLLNKVLKIEKDLENERHAFTTANPQNTGNSDPAKTSQALKIYKRKGQVLLNESNMFTKAVARSEQPFGKINSLVIDAKRRRNITTSFEFDEAIIQTGFQYRGQSLSLRLNWAILWDWDTIYNNSGVDTYIRDRLHSDIVHQLKGLKTRCITLSQSSNEANLPLHEIEARIYHAQFVALELSHQSKGSGPPVTEEDRSREASIAAARQAEAESLEECKHICTQFPGTTAHLEPDITKALRLLNGSTFYSFVTTEEQQEIYQAMAGQFRGTGHWYYCANNHPFTVGECGMPMELARCPECGAQVGGRDHVATAGVRAATDLDGRFAGTTTFRARAPAAHRAPAAPRAPAAAPRAPAAAAAPMAPAAAPRAPAAAPRAPAAAPRAPAAAPMAPAAIPRAPAVAPRAPAAVQIPAAPQARVQVAAQVPGAAQVPEEARLPVAARVQVAVQVPALVRARAPVAPLAAQVPALARDPIVAPIQAGARAPVVAQVPALARARAPVAPAPVAPAAQVPALARDTIVAPIPRVPVAPVAAQVPVLARARTPVAPAAAQVPALARDPIAAPIQAGARAPVAFQAPAPARNQLVAQIPVETRSPVAARALVASRVPAPARDPIVAQIPAEARVPGTSRVPVAAQDPAPARAPTVIQVPTATRVPAAAQVPMVGRAPVVAQVPASGQGSAAARALAAAQTSVSTRVSLTAQASVGAHQAIASQSQEARHLYYCENNHLFTIGEREILSEVRCYRCRTQAVRRHRAVTTGVRETVDRNAAAARAPAPARASATDHVPARVPAAVATQSPAVAQVPAETRAPAAKKAGGLAGFWNSIFS